MASDADWIGADIMTTHTAITDYFSGATLDAGSLLCHRTTDATVETASATSEKSAGSAVYSVVFSDVTAGRYRLKLLAAGEVVATRDVEFAGTDAEVVETGYAVLNAGGPTAVVIEEAISNDNDGIATQQGIADKVVSTLLNISNTPVEIIDSDVTEFSFGVPKPSPTPYVGHVERR